MSSQEQTGNKSEGVKTRFSAGVHRIHRLGCVSEAHNTVSPQLSLTFGRGGVHTLSKQCRLSGDSGTDVTGKHVFACGCEVNPYGLDSA